jgi:hypothetical protein
MVPAWQPRADYQDCPDLCDSSLGAPGFFAGSGAQLSMCERLVEGIIDAYPARKEGDYPAWLKCIREHLSPNAAALTGSQWAA